MEILFHSSDSLLPVERLGRDPLANRLVQVTPAERLRNARPLVPVYADV